MASRRRNNVIESIEERNPELAAFVRQVAEEEGKSPEQVITEALQRWYTWRAVTLAKMDVEQLIAALDFWDHIYRRAIQSAFATISLWQALADVFNAFMNLYSTIYSVAKQATDEDTKKQIFERLMKWAETMMDKMERRVQFMFAAHPLLKDIGLPGGTHVDEGRSESTDKAKAAVEIRVEDK